MVLEHWVRLNILLKDFRMTVWSGLYNCMASFFLKYRIVTKFYTQVRLSLLVIFPQRHYIRFDRFLAQIHPWSCLATIGFFDSFLAIRTFILGKSSIIWKLSSPTFHRYMIWGCVLPDSKNINKSLKNP